MRSRSLTGKPARMLRTAWTDEWAEAGRAGHAARCRCRACSWPTPSCASTARPTRAAGAQQLDTYFVGQVVGALDRVKPARQVVLDMVEEYIDSYERLHTLTL